MSHKLFILTLLMKPKGAGARSKGGRGAGTALEDLEDKEAGGELGNVGSTWVYISFQKGDS